ncbi:MAG: hypothetical protein ACTSU5_08270 [Promethearchaeota archaeon]
MTRMPLGYDLGVKMAGWGSAMAVCLVLGTTFAARAVKARKSDVESVKWVYLGYSLFFFLYVVTRLFLLLSDLERVNTPEGQPDTIWYTRWVIFAYMTSQVAMTFIIYTFERWMLARERRTLTWIAFGSTLFCAGFAATSFFTDNSNLINVARLMDYGAAALFFVILLYLMYRLAKDSSGVIKRNAATSLVGAVLILTGILIDSEFLFKYLGPGLMWLPGVVAAAGLVVFGLGQRKA